VIGFAHQHLIASPLSTLNPIPGKGMEPVEIFTLKLTDGFISQLHMVMPFKVS
jgi:hypothetical protein